MATKQSTVEYLVDQMSSAGAVTCRKMFGEYAIYCDGKVVALVCDDRLFVKPTADGRTWIKSVKEKPPYPGAKSYFLIDEDQWDQREWLSELIAKTATALPSPKQKR
ncbi:MAG: TfoX/Sxy family protein [Candidatus Peribacteraceae bacterium]|nr:TfoX/Sxy family protein [Candidatus Peribacteraceae bacterium]MDD5075338.1 TfoX/Sxy family protein [Candidatus Peribacteraceae bacterium]